MTLPESIARLPRRSAEVTRLLFTGASEKEIAALLFITRKTVSGHTQKIFRLLGVNSRVQLMARRIAELEQSAQSFTKSGEAY